ncbi:amidase [Pusillimonas sp. ANT_WB101]|uniref:amidase n=1 Tax=Pusillimonas sp. ANT_WB101 TaxID=2597356 RepID=UPI0011ECA83E|nr:amidase [Pusillimonas sp. ANT_WB101]KAA0892686.1 amidase [Pusillimonas sp. ANT_WB101]
MKSDDIWRWSATCTAKAVTRGSLGAEQVVHAIADRIAAANPQVNAFALLGIDSAIDQARSQDMARAAGAPAGPLEGVPFHVKDLIPTQGMETAYGSHTMTGNVPGADARAVARLKAAGAILIGKTTTPEFGAKILTNSPRHGHTHNPWNLARTSGGSSGGSAAAVAAGMGPIAVNTDGAGSARVPAACCGVLGFKPTIGLIPNDMAAALFENHQYIGLNTRTVPDLALALSVMNGPDVGDPWTLGRTPIRFAVPPDPVSALRGLRILYVPTMGNRLVDESILARLEAMLDLLVEHGVKVQRMDGEFDWGAKLSGAWLRASLHARIGHLLATDRDRLDPNLVATLEAGSRTSISETEGLPLARTQLFHRVQQLFSTTDLIVTPTVAAPAIDLDHAPNAPLVINGEVAGLLRDAWWPYTGLANLTGHPAISVPMGFCADATPAGLHAMSQYHEDQRLLDLAAAMEVLAPWAQHWPTC